MKLAEIVFPVFRLGEKCPIVQDGLVYYKAEYSDKDTAEHTTNYRLIDDRNIDKPALGLRRLVLLHKYILFPIGTAIYFLVDIIKLAKSTTWFIDSNGNIFQHKKTKRAKLTTKKIKQVLPADGIGCVLELEGISSRFKTMKQPNTYEQYAGVLHMDNSYLLYGYFESPQKDTWRLV
jgi:hypothetical protein